MSVSVSEQQVAAATAYENLHVPALFEQWAPIVAEAASIRRGDRVLDVACGTGVLAREVSSRVGEEGFVAGVDADPGMLAVAGRICPTVEWHHATADRLPFEAGSFDAVVSQFGLMFFQDRRAAIREMVRVLAVAGRVGLAVWDSLENSEAYLIEVELIEQMAGKGAAEALRAPFVMGDRTELKALLEDAGAEGVAVDTRRGTARFPSIRTMVEADLRGWLPLMGIILPEDRIAQILDRSEEALAAYVVGDGTVEFDAPAHIVSGRKALS